jgi:hypothetical protein
MDPYRSTGGVPSTDGGRRIEDPDPPCPSNVPTGGRHSEAVGT